MRERIKSALRRIMPDRTDFALVMIAIGTYLEFGIGVSLLVCGIIIGVIEFMPIILSHRGGE